MSLYTCANHGRYKPGCPRCIERRRESRRAKITNACVDCGGQVSTNAVKRCNACSSLNRRTWTKEQILIAIHRFYIQHGRVPTGPEWMKAGVDRPATGVIRREFGSMSNAIEAAGFTRRRSGTNLKPRVGRTPRMRRTVANGFTPEEELEELIAEQKREMRGRYREYPQKRVLALDPLSDFYRSQRGLGGSYSDRWTWAVCVVVDWRRDIDQWAEAA